MLMMIMLRMMVLRKRTDPKTGTHTLYEPAESKCTWTCYKSHFMRTVSKDAGPRSATQTLWEPAQSEPLYAEIYWKNAGAQKREADFVRACAVEVHLRHFTRATLYRNLQENATPSWSTLIKHRPLYLP